MAELDDDVYESIKSLCAKGDELADEVEYDSAVRTYWEAFDLLPEPRVEWEAATWILCAIGEAHFLKGDFSRAQEAFMGAVRGPDGLGNPYIHLRLGECAFELGQMQMSRAEDELTRAYMGAGREIFADEDLKYFKHLQTVLLPPPGETSI